MAKANNTRRASRRATMVSRVAKAIKRWDLGLHPARAERMAIAAIEAMREITGEVGDAGYDAFERWERGESENIMPHGPIWRAMIDAALTESDHG